MNDRTLLEKPKRVTGNVTVSFGRKSVTMVLPPPEESVALLLPKENGTGKGKGKGKDKEKKEK